MIPHLPAAARPFVALARTLRDHDFPVTTDQTVAFLRSIDLLGPRTIADIYWAARATLAPSPDRLGEFDFLFNAAFREDYGVIPSARALEGEESKVAESGAGTLDPVAAERAEESGATASSGEVLSVRALRVRQSDRLRLMQRRLATSAPTRIGYRHARAKAGARLDLRRTLSRMVRSGDADNAPAWTARARKHRRVLLLVDISGSMKAHTDETLRFAHALTHALPDVETFSFGTRLTRLTRSLRHKDAARAMAEIAPSVADWSGGTRIADSIEAFLAVHRFSRASRGALVIVVSDGLERGSAQAMRHAVRRLAARSWRTAWLTPLAADPAFRPETEGLKAILDVIDHLGDGSGISSLATFMEQASQLGSHRPAPGRSGGKTHATAADRRASSHLAAAGSSLARRAHAPPDLRAV